MREGEEREKQVREKLERERKRTVTDVQDDEDLHSREDGWTKVAGKRSGNRNVTTIYLTNLPNGCTSNTLWKSFDFVKTLVDAYVPLKRDSRGKTFGFLFFGKGVPAEETLKKVQDTKVNGSKIFANFAKYGKETRRPRTHHERNMNAAPMHSSAKPGNTGVWNTSRNHNTSYTRGVSYRDILIGKAKDSEKFAVEMGRELENPFKDLYNKAVVGNAIDMYILNNLPNIHRPLIQHKAIFRYLGGMKVLISFKTESKTMSFLEAKEGGWDKFFFYWICGKGNAYKTIDSLGFESPESRCRHGEE